MASNRMPKNAPASGRHRNGGVFTLEAKMDVGRRAFQRLQESLGPAYAELWAKELKSKMQRRTRGEDMQGHCDISLPRRFLRSVVTEDLCLKWTDQSRMRVTRALEVFVERRDFGFTALAQRNGRRKLSRRSDGGARNALKPGSESLSHSLLQWFVDDCISIGCRADYILVKMELLRMYRYLLRSGTVPLEDLPKLDTNSGIKSWLLRWRRRYRISKRSSWNRLKVTWARIKQRCRTLLTNIFRLATPRVSSRALQPQSTPLGLGRARGFAGQERSRLQFWGSPTCTGCELCGNFATENGLCGGAQRTKNRPTLTMPATQERMH